MTIPRIQSTDLMLAYKSHPFTREGWLYAIKFDGYRALVTKEGKAVQIQSRRGIDMTSWFPEVASAVSAIRGDFIIDCEVCAVDEHGRSDFEALRPLAQRRSADGRTIALLCFDLLFCKSDWRSRPLRTRLERLEELIGHGRDHILFVRHIEEQGEALYQKVLSLGLEGIVAKRADSQYVGGRSRNWLKIKTPHYHSGWKRLKRVFDPAI